MTRKKQIILPIVIIVTGIVLFTFFKSMKKPPEKKTETDNTPIVAIEEVIVTPLTLKVNSYGIVKPKYETEMVAQISGEIVELSPIFIRGGFVKKGQLLARIDPNDYQAILIDAEANMASARASLEKERAQGKVAQKEWKTITDSSPSELSLRKPQLAQQLASVKSAQARVLRASRNLERTEIRAPYDAIIDSRKIGLGSYVSTGSMVGKLLGTSIAEVRLPVADNQLAFLVAQGVEAPVDLHGTFSGQEIVWTAKITRSEGVIDTKSRMSYLVAEIHDPYALTNKNQTPIRFGSYIKAKILGIEIAQATRVPRHLVENDRVAVLDSESKLHYSKVHIVRQDGQDVIISNGLVTGDQLIVSTLDYPVAGMKLALMDKRVENNSAAKTETDTQVVSNNSVSGQ